MPQQQPQREGRRRERPELPGRRAVPQQVAGVGEPANRAAAQVSAVGDQTETGEESQQVCARQAKQRCQRPGRQRQQRTDGRPAPRHDQRARVGVHFGSRKGERAEHHALDLSAGCASRSDVANLVDGHHSQPAQRQQRDNQQHLVKSAHRRNPCAAGCRFAHHHLARGAIQPSCSRVRDAVTFGVACFTRVLLDWRLDRQDAQMAEPLSKSQIDKLGERLKAGNISEDDLRLLDQYRRSFRPAYDYVVGRIREHLDLAPTGRPAKTRTALADKLQRESIRLSQVQDIAGCRIVVRAIAEQDNAVAELLRLFPDANVMDRRESPSHGYRAVHVIPRIDDRLIEIQVRTYLQDLWAQLSEKLADAIDPAIKYGGGSDSTRSLLAFASAQVASLESYERAVQRVTEQSEEFERKTFELKDRIEGSPELERRHAKELARLREDLSDSRRTRAENEEEFKMSFKQLEAFLTEALKRFQNADG